MLYGYVFRKGEGTDYTRNPEFSISLQLFLEKYAVIYSIDALERFVFLGDNPLVPDAIFVASWVKISEASQILAEEFGIDANFVTWIKGDFV